MARRRIPEATVARLAVYLRVLADARAARRPTVSSEQMAAGAGVNAAQVRKDLSFLGSFGVRGVGYEVDLLARRIQRELGVTESRRVAVVGVGNLGEALCNYAGFAGRGFRVVVAFDRDPAKVGRCIGAVTVHPTSRLPEMVAAHRVEMAVLTVPVGAAQEEADRLVAAGVTSILNFAPVTLSVPPPVALRQVDLGTELQILRFHEQYNVAQQRAGLGQVADAG